MGRRIDNSSARQDVLRAVSSRRNWFGGSGTSPTGLGYSPIDYIRDAGGCASQSAPLVRGNTNPQSNFMAGVRRGNLRFHHRSPNSRRAILFGLQVSSRSECQAGQVEVRNVAVMALSASEMYQVSVVAEPGFYSGDTLDSESRGEKSGGGSRVISVGSCVFGYWTVPSRGDLRRAPDAAAGASAVHEGEYRLISARSRVGLARPEWEDDACQASWPELSGHGVFSAWDACGELFGGRSWRDRYAELHRWVRDSQERRRANELRVVINPCTPFSLFAPWVRRAQAGGSLRPETPLRICVFSSPFGVSGPMYHWKNAMHVRMRCLSADASACGGGNAVMRPALQSAVQIRSEDGKVLNDILRGTLWCDEASRRVSVVGIGARSFRCGSTGRVCDFLMRWWSDPAGESSPPNIVLRLLHAPALTPGLITRAMNADEIARTLRDAASQIPFRNLYDLSQSKSPSWTSASSNGRIAASAMAPSPPLHPMRGRVPVLRPEIQPKGPPPGRLGSRPKRKAKKRPRLILVPPGGEDTLAPISPPLRRSSRLKRKMAAGAGDAGSPRVEVRTGSTSSRPRRKRARVCSASR